jgi:hypothetical protein
VVVLGSTATFSRKVWNQDNSAVVGTEEGNGEVNGEAIKLHLVWKSAGAIAKCTFTGSYEGHLKGNKGSLKGTQDWNVDGKGERRACTISLNR